MIAGLSCPEDAGEEHPWSLMDLQHCRWTAESDRNGGSATADAQSDTLPIIALTPPAGRREHCRAAARTLPDQKTFPLHDRRSILDRW